MTGLAVPYFTAGAAVVTLMGVVGDGVTDDTTAINNILQNLTGKTVVFPAGDYLVSNTLNIPAASHSFEIIGLGKCNIIQSGGNKACFKFMDEGNYNFKISGFRFKWGTGLAPVLSTDTQSNGIMFSGVGVTGNGSYDWEFSNLRLLNGMHLITTDPAASALATIGFWGGDITGLFMESLHVGSAIRLAGVAGGYPAVNVNTVYSYAGNCLNPLINVQGGDTWIITNVERNKAGEFVANTPQCLVFTSCRNINIDGLRFENEYYKGSVINGGGLVISANTDMSVKNVSWTSPLDFNLAAGTAIVSVFNNSAANINVTIDHFRVAKINASAISAFTLGSLYMVAPLSTGLMSIHIGNNYAIDDYQGSALVTTRDAGIRNYANYKEAFMLKGVVTGLTGSPSFVNVSLQGLANFLTLYENCSLIGIRMKSSANLAGAGLRLYAYKNGVAIPAYLATMALGTASAEYNSDPIYSPGVGLGVQFVPGDTINLKYESTGAISSTTDIEFTAIFAKR